MNKEKIIVWLKNKYEEGNENAQKSDTCFIEGFSLGKVNLSIELLELIQAGAFD